MTETRVHTLLSALLQADPRAASVTSVAAHLRACARVDAPPIERAIRGGFASDRLAYAFAAGYDAALHALLPSLAREQHAALCATEEGGAHPRAIATKLETRDGALLLTGRKKWATLATEANALLVVAREGTDDRGRPRLRVARIQAAATGVRIDRMPETPFAPEIAHAEVTLDAVAVGANDLLPGDGYDAYLKPFRTVEDVHVLAALLGHVVRVARAHAWDDDAVSRTLALVVGVRALADADARSPAAHVALAGCFDAVRAHLAACEPQWARVDAEVRARFERDRPLLEVAGRARAARLEVAWRALQSPSG